MIIRSPSKNQVSFYGKHSPRWDSKAMTHGGWRGRTPARSCQGPSPSRGRLRRARRWGQGGPWCPVPAARRSGKLRGQGGWQRRGRGPRSPREGEPRTAPPAAGSRGGRGGGGGHKVSASAAAPCSAERAPLRPAGPPSLPSGPGPTLLPPGDTRLAAMGVSADRPGRLVHAASPGKGARPWRARAAPAPLCVQQRPGSTRDPPRPRAPWGRGSYRAPRAPAAAVLRAAAAAHAPPGPCRRGPVRGGRGPRRSRRRRRRRRLWK